MNIGYHTRLHKDHTVKVIGGCFGGDISMTTVNRLVKSHFKVAITPSGSPVFVDSQGREVRLYVSVDADKTELGIAALREWRAEQARQDAQLAEETERREAEILGLMEGLSHAEIVKRLRDAG